MTAEKELERLEREITGDKEQAPKGKRGLLRAAAKQGNPTELLGHA